MRILPLLSPAICDTSLQNNYGSYLRKKTIVYFKSPGPWFFGRKIKSTQSIFVTHTFLKRLEQCNCFDVWMKKIAWNIKKLWYFLQKACAVSSSSRSSSTFNLYSYIRVILRTRGADFWNRLKKKKTQSNPRLLKVNGSLVNFMFKQSER